MNVNLYTASTHTPKLFSCRYLVATISSNSTVCLRPVPLSRWGFSSSLFCRASVRLLLSSQSLAILIRRASLLLSMSAVSPRAVKEGGLGLLGGGVNASSISSFERHKNAIAQGPKPSPIVTGDLHAFPQLTRRASGASASLTILSSASSNRELTSSEGMGLLRRDDGSASSALDEVDGADDTAVDDDDDDDDDVDEDDDDDDGDDADAGDGA